MVIIYLIWFVMNEAYLDAVIAPKSIQLVQEFQHRSLHLTVTTLLRVETFRANGVKFIDENDSRGLFFGQRKCITNKLGTITDEHLNQRRTGKFQITSFC